MLGDFQRHLQFLGLRPESDVEYLSQPLAYLSPEGAFDGESLNGQPMVFRAGSARELGEFRRDKDRLVVELAQIERGGEGVLVSLGSLVQRYARLQGIESVEWIVHAVTCAKANLKLRRVLDRRDLRYATSRDRPSLLLFGF